LIYVVPIGYEAGWASEPVWMQSLDEKLLAPAGDRTPVVHSAVRKLYQLRHLGSVALNLIE
jgi:hypothetical protein